MVIDEAQEAPPPAPPEPTPEDIVKQQAETEGEPLPPDMPAPIAYTKAELDAAKAEIELLTPEQWIEMVRYIHSLEDVGALGEAPGIAWTTLYSKKTGGQMNVTSRATTTKAAVEDMFAAVTHIMKWQSHMSWSPSKTYSSAPSTPTNSKPAPASTASAPPPAAGAQEPTYAPVEGSGVEKFQVASVAHSVSKNGHHHVIVKTVEPALAKFGVNAWKEVVPVDFESWPVNAEYQPPPEMAYCLVDTANKPKKVTAFTTE
ncbi:MAG: hypothetical protein ACW99G_19325 [Candidatus Thorarchaeota archaeon]|jgi:hypothetical protein